VSGFSTDATWLSGELARLAMPLSSDDLRSLVDGMNASERQELTEPGMHTQLISYDHIEAVGNVFFDSCAALAEVVIGKLLPFDPLAGLSSDLLAKGQTSLRKRLLDRRREAINATIEHALNQFFISLPGILSERADPLYTDLAAYAQDRYDAWWQTRLGIWSRKTHEWERLQGEAHRLGNEVRSWLSSVNSP